MRRSEIKLIRERMSAIRADFTTKYGGSKTKRMLVFKSRLHTAQHGLCYYCGEQIDLNDVTYSGRRRSYSWDAALVPTSTGAIGHILSAKHCAILSSSTKEACELANREENLALICASPCK